VTLLCPRSLLWLIQPHPPVHLLFSSSVDSSLTYFCSADFPIQDPGISQDTGCGRLYMKSFAFPHHCQLLVLQQKTGCTQRLRLLLWMRKPEGSTPSVVTFAACTNSKSLHAVRLFRVPLLHYSDVEACANHLGSNCCAAATHKECLGFDQRRNTLSGRADTQARDFVGVAHLSTWRQLLRVSHG